MEVDIILNGQLTESAGLPGEPHKNDNNVQNRTLSKDKKYHVFFCYRDVPNDNRFVKDVVRKLENEYGFVCCDHERDFAPGTKIMDNIKYGIKKSEKVVSILSKEGLDSEYLRLETEMAHREGIDKRENLLIPILLDDCEMPEELKLLTYIDARKEKNETTWWPKLIAAIESKEGCPFFNGRKEEETKQNADDQPAFYFKQLCSLGTTFSCQRCSIESTPKYIPRELVSKEEVVPVETIKNLKRDLLDVPRIRCKQKCCCFVNGCLWFCLLLGVLAVIFDILVINACTTTDAVSKEDCFRDVGLYVIFEISIGICCGFGWKCYYKIYVLFHLSEDRKTEREKCINISGIEAQHNEEYVPLLAAYENEDLAQATETRNWRHDMEIETETSFVDTPKMQEKHIADDVPLLTVSENEQLDQPVERNVALRPMADDQESTIISLTDQENRSQQFTQNSEFAQSSDLDNLENVAMTLLLKYAHEYLRLAFSRKINNPKEDRHNADYMCLCQYIEKADKKFRKIVDRNNIIHAKNLSIERVPENNKLDAFLL